MIVRESISQFVRGQDPKETLSVGMHRKIEWPFNPMDLEDGYYIALADRLLKLIALADPLYKEKIIIQIEKEDLTVKRISGWEYADHPFRNSTRNWHAPIIIGSIFYLPTWFKDNSVLWMKYIGDTFGKNDYDKWETV